MNGFPGPGEHRRPPSSGLWSRPGVGICQRVSGVVETVDAQVKRAELN